MRHFTNPEAYHPTKDQDPHPVQNRHARRRTDKLRRRFLNSAGHRAWCVREATRMVRFRAQYERAQAASPG